MLVYITGTFISVLFAYISTHIENTESIGISAKRMAKKFFSILSVMPLLLVMAFRRGVGTDFWNYVNIFRYGNRSIEEGYSFLNNILRGITDDYYSIFIVSAIIICGCYFYMIYKESINPAYSVLLFVLCKDYFIAMNGMRQYISTAIVILAIPFVKKKEWLKAALIFVVAFLFHRSVIIFLLLIALYLINIRPAIGAAMVAGTLVLSNTVLRFIFPIMQRFGFYDGYISIRYVLSNATGDFNWRYTLIFLCFFIMLSYEYNNVKKSEELKLMYSAVLTSLLVMSLSLVMPFVHRLTWHMDSLLVLYTPLAVKSIHDKRISKALEFVIPVAFALITISDITLNSNQDVLPYRSIWSN